jgi:hypothetical protein
VEKLVLSAENAHVAKIDLSGKGTVGAYSRFFDIIK